MHASNAAARRNALAKKLLLAAIGVAGCTGGSKLTLATNDTPSALVQPGDATQQADPQSGRSYLAQVASNGPQSIWGRKTAASQTAPRDPFVSNRSGGFHAVPTATPADRLAASSPARRPRTGLVQPVAFEETNAYCGTPTGVTIQPRQDTPGVVRIQDPRLPPAKPLGASNPFDKQTAATAKPRIQATRATNRVAAKPATNTSVQIKPAERREFKTLPVQQYLTKKVSTDGTAASPIRHEDMIVDTAILPKRRDWRASTLPPSSQSSEQFVISSRAPFATPEWDGTKANSASSANLPMEISPASASDRASETMQIAKRSEIPAASDITPPATVPDPFDLPAEPVAEAAADPDFLEAPQFSTTEPAEPLAIAEAPMLAPGSVVSAPEPSGDAKLISGPAMAPAPPADPGTSAETVANVAPVQLDQANEAAAQEAARGQNAFGTPAVIGIALAIVAFGAVVIRRRFA
jgi:hypothetical protein